MSIENVLLREIKNMSENDVKKTLSTLLLSYEKVGKNGYTEKEFLKQVSNTIRDIVVDDMFLK